MQEEHLPATRELGLYRGGDRLVGVPHDARLDGDARARRGPKEGEVARARHREVERPRNGRGRERQHVGRGAKPLQELLVPHAETLLLVDDYQPQVVEAYLRVQDRVRADDYVAHSRLEALERAFVRAAALEARDGLYSYGRSVEARGEGLEVLFRQDRCRRKHRNLASAHRHDERRAHGDFGLAVARVAADEAVHGLAGGEVVVYRGDGGELVRRLLVGEGGVESVPAFAGDVVGGPRRRLALRLRLEESRRQVTHRLLRVLLVLLPPLAVQPVQPHGFALDADIAREEVRVCGRDVQLSAVGVLDREDFAALPVE